MSGVMKNHKICDSLAKYFRNKSFGLTLSSSDSDSDSEKENKLTNSIKTAKREIRIRNNHGRKENTKINIYRQHSRLRHIVSVSFD